MPTDDRKTANDAEADAPIQDLDPRNVESQPEGEVKGGATTTGGATVGKANFDVFTAPKGIDTATTN